MHNSKNAYHFPQKIVLTAIRKAKQNKMDYS